MTCPFCDRRAEDDLVAQNDLAVAFVDRYPLNPGHTLIVPRRHEPNFLALTEAEHTEVWRLVPASRLGRCRVELDA